MSRAKYGEDNPSCRYPDEIVEKVLTYKDENPTAGARKIMKAMPDLNLKRTTVDKWLYGVNRWKTSLKR